MIIIHSADQHLDSKLTANLSKEKAKERKAEILITFKNMIEHARDIGAKAVLLAGDLFDTKTVAATERKAVESAIRDNPEILFFYLKGNHDMNSFLSSLDQMPDNLKLFNDKWTTYELTDTISITGAELNKNNELSLYNELSLDSRCFNIVMLHGQENEYQAKDKTEVIALNELRNRSIDYLALGHVHEYKYKELDARGAYCYPGCLEGRGFDETGNHGFVVLDIDEANRTFTHEFVSMSRRVLHEVELDVTDASSTSDIEKLVARALSSKVDSIRKKDLLKIVLTGSILGECDVDIAYLTKCFEDDYYFVKLKDKTNIKIDYTRYKHDQSLKGEFVRMVYSDSDLSDEEKAQIITKGIELLKAD